MKLPFKVVGIGEVLWDVFHDGARFGGAPANMACTLAELAGKEAIVHMISTIGEDTLGIDALHSLKIHNVETALIQSSSFPTGTVNVSLDESHQANYTFAENSAWDHLLWDDSWNDIAANTDAVCFGSLAQRSEVSRKTIRKFLEVLPQKTIKVFDINLRAPFYNSKIILNSLELANVLKLNEEELPVIAKILDISGDRNSLLRKIQHQYDLNSIALTKGKNGATLIHYDELVEVPIVPSKVIDTVGAGDSFTAAFIYGLLRDEKLIDIAQFAVKVSSYVCSQRGATPTLPQSKFKFN